jgi:hypothetical protein
MNIRELTMAESADAQKISDAFNGSRYKWRTISGVAKELGVPEEAVSKYVRDSNLFVRSKVPNKKGQALYTTVDKYQKHTSFWGRFLGAGANTVSS